MTTRGTRASHRGVAVGLLLALPALAIALNILVWITAVSRSGFWADDFLNVTHFARSLGQLSDDHINDGHYIINVFWALGTEAFGTGSAMPFIMLNSLILAAGVVTWLWAGTKSTWGSLDAWWIGALFLAAGAWLQTALWSSNITHSGGFLALGLGILAHQRAVSARTTRSSHLWSAASGSAWTLAIVSNVLYVGLLVIAAYCALRQISHLRKLGSTARRSIAFVGSWNLVLPLIYFLAVAYPATTASQPYANNGLGFIHANLRFYRSLLAPTDLLTALYVALLLGGIMAALIALRRRRDLFPLALLGAATTTALPALVQGQQREFHYMAMPLLLFFSALAAGFRPLLSGASKQLTAIASLCAAIALWLIFQQGSEVRAYFAQTPYGSSLAVFRSEVASLTPAGAAICARLDLDAPGQALFIAEMSGLNGFLVPPIAATQAYLVTGTQPCPPNAAITHITVKMNPRGAFVASA